MAANQILSPLENALIVGAFRDFINGYYQSYTHAHNVTYPQIEPDSSDYWKERAPTLQKRLAKAGITNTAQLVEAVKEYEVIYRNVKDIGFDRTAQEIQNYENQYRLWQKDDIQFTAPEAAEQIVSMANLTPESVVLEPSAGIGNIADEARKITPHVDCIECVYDFRELLKLKGHHVVGDNFLEFEKADYYDAIIMNPPFSNNQDIEHLKHAYSLEKNGGVVVCITSYHWTFAGDKKSKEFRKWLENTPHSTIPLPSKIFEKTGINCQVVLVAKEEQDNLIELNGFSNKVHDTVGA